MCPVRVFFCCLKQDGQDVQDGQDGCRLGIRPKGLEDLNVYSISRNKMTRSERTLICSSGRDACEGQALALQEPARFFS